MGLKIHRDILKRWNRRYLGERNNTMKIDSSKKVNDVAGEHVVISQDNGTSNMTTVVGLNESAYLLYNRLKGREFGIDDVVSILMEEYDIDEATARNDAEMWEKQMREQNMII